MSVVVRGEIPSPIWSTRFKPVSQGEGREGKKKKRENDVQLGFRTENAASISIDNEEVAPV